MLKYLAITMALLVVFGGACKSSSKAKAQTFAVQVDAPKGTFAATFFTYFPNEVDAHPGDTVQFTSHFTGEPHSVTFGKDVDADFALIAKACPSGVHAPPCDQGPPEQYKAQADQLNAELPPLLPDNPTQPQSQAAAQPCFLTTGHAPTDNSACSAAQQTQPAFDGTQTYFNSGYLQDQAVFTVKLADTIAPGTYHFFCLLHREDMSGTITVVAKSAKVATPAEVKKKGDDALSGTVTKLKPEFDKLASLKADTAQAGAVNFEQVPNGQVNEFGPSEIDIPVGGSATWSIVGIHSISFNAPADARASILIKGSDGKWELNSKAGAPAPEGAPGQAPPDPNAPPPDPNAPPTVIDAGSWDGSGFHSSGFIDAFNAPFAYKVTFTKAGTYKYVCLIHTDMEGTVKVGG